MCHLLRSVALLLLFSLISPFSYCDGIGDGSDGSPNIQGVVNVYTSVSYLISSSCTTKIVVSDTAGFSTGDLVFIIQMQGATIDTSNTSSYGSVLNYINTGNHEFTNITTIVGDTIIVDLIQNSYSISGKVQLIRVPQYNNPVVTSVLTCPAWNGTTGGVVVIDALGTITLNSNIDVSGKGFRGGGYINSSGIVNCFINYFTNSNFLGARKGEGIASSYLNQNIYGKGAPANGGGGGNNHNGGGGGGGWGGDGGRIASQCLSLQVGGLGGIGLNYTLSPVRAFMGGGAGSGHGNNNVGTSGAAGGGIVYVNALNISGSGNVITKGNNGQTTASTAGDGAGGGGAGGAIIVNSSNVSSLITFNVSGGDGGDVSLAGTMSDRHGPGGGGSGGVVWFADSALPVSVGNIIKNGGGNGTNININNDPYFATPGDTGIVLTGYSLLFAPQQFTTIVDTSICDGTSYYAGGGFQTTAGTYIDYISFSNGCYGIILTNLSIIPAPVANAGPPISIINGTSITLNGSAGGTGPFTYTWVPAALLINPNVFNPTTVALSTTTTFTLTVIDVTTGCSNTSQVTVTVVGTAFLITNISASPSIICIGDSSQLNVSVNGGASNISFTWTSSPPGFTSNLQNPVVFPVSTTNYTVSVTDSSGTTDTNITVIVNPIPNAYAGNDSIICNGDYITYTATGGSLYLWSTSAITASITVNPSNSIDIWVKVSDSIGCSSYDTVSITVLPTPLADGGSDTSICSGDSVTLTAGNIGVGGSYTWNTTPNQYTQQIIVTPAVTTTYMLTVANPYGCSDMDIVVVTVNSSPNVTASADTTICEGTSTTISASGGIAYTWNTNPVQFAPQITVFPNITTNYIVTAFHMSGCTATEEVIITVNPAPNANAGLDTGICIYTSATLIATGGVSYLWNTTPQQTTATIVVNPTVNTSYTVTVSDNIGCTATDDINVTVSQPPVANAGSDTTICEGTTVTLMASGGVSYLWNTTPAQITVFANVTPSVTTTYTVVVTDALGCSETDDVLVTVNPKPVVTASNDTTICYGDTISITSGGGSNYVWSTIPVQNTQSITVYPSANTLYTVSVTGLLGCTDTEDVIVLVIQTNNLANAGPDTTICEGDSTTLLAIFTAPFYLWSTSPPQNTASITVMPTSSITYILTVTDSIGCYDIDSVDVIVQPLPVVFLGNDTSVCYGDSVTFDAGPGTYSYLWQNNSTSQTYSATSTGILWVEVMDTYGCSNIDSVNFVVMAEPYVSFGPDTTVCSEDTITFDAGGGYINYLWQDASTNQTFTTNNSGLYWVIIEDSIGCSGYDSITLSIYQPTVISIGNDTSICFGESVTFDPGSGFNSYLWHDASTNQTYTATLAGLYWVAIIDTNSCKTRDSVVLFINPLPVIDIGNDTTLCSDEYLTLDPGSGFANYLWQDGSTSQTYTADKAGFYWITVEDGNGCISKDSLTLVMFKRPEVNLGEDKFICNDHSFILDGGPDGVTYLWQDGSGRRSYTAAESGVYWVEVTNGTCIGRDTITLFICTEIWIPNAFSPNGDGINDEFKAFGYGVTKFQMLIFDRFGRVIFESNDINIGWDGTSRNMVCPLGVYTWLVIYEGIGNVILEWEAKRKQGTVTLFR